jgi:hypothetical protein
VRLFEAKTLTSFPAGLLIGDYNEENFFVRQAYFPGGNITVTGLHWCKVGPKTVGLAALTGKILCRKTQQRTQ